MSIALICSAALFTNVPLPPAAKAASLEINGQYDAALTEYLRLHDTDRTALPDLSARIHRCVRAAAQFRRHGDPAFQRYLLTLSLADALTLYTDVIEKLGRYYADAEPTSPAGLFGFGKEELSKALTNPVFAVRHLPGADPARLRGVREWLANFQIPPTANLREIRVAVRDVALGLREAVPGCNPVAVIIEFLAGACAGLDEHTAFHPPGTRSTVATGPTVTGVTMSDERLGVGYLRITEFADTTAAEFDAAVGPLKQRGLRSLVVDLRGNPGGLLTAGIDVARKLLPPGVIVRTVGQSPEFANREFVSESATPAFDLPLVLLVDAGTMSAAEVVAGAVKDHRRGTLVGTRTHGKGTVQVPVKTATADKTAPAGVIVLTVARTTGPAGQPLAHGIIPDVPERDPERQLKTALAEAKALAATGRPMN